MADLPSNLDDGELWLPSDVICAVGICRHHHPSDDLTQKLASFALFDRCHAIPAVTPIRDSPFYPDFYEQGRLVSWLSPVNLSYKVPLGRRVATKTVTCCGGGGGGRTDHILPFPPAIHKFNRGMPLDSCVDEFRLERARVLQRHRQQQQQQQQGYALNRFVPVRATGFRRECGGTGVFLPRALCEDAKTKPLSLKGNGQFQHATCNPMLGDKASKKMNSSSEMGLPQDWTY